MNLRVRSVDVFLRRVRTRIPFRYGKAVVTELPYAHLRVRFEPEVVGVSAQALPPLWFDKTAGRSHEDDIRDLLRSISIASEVYRAAPAGTVHALHQACEPEARRRAAAEKMNGLTAGFGVALLDLATIDGACRLSGRTFHQGLRDGLFGLTVPGLPDRPLDRIAVRHTVGMADPITSADVATPLGDGLPETLEEVVVKTGVRWFKVKVSGNAEASLDRLRRIAAVVDRGAREYQVTLDGNEQFHDAEEVAAFVRKIEAEPALANFWKRTVWIEQPVERGAALSPGTTGALRSISRPVILDESDGSDDVVDQGLAMGYGGISAKNCKGPFRTLHSFGRVREKSAVLSSEDLMNIPVVPLHQDLCIAAALGIPHSERNGHHYVRAFEYFSPRERDAALREFPELYRSDPASVRVADGMLDLKSINAFAFGVRSEPDWDFLEPVDLVKRGP